MDINDFFSFSTKLLSTTFQAIPISLMGSDYEKLLMGDCETISLPVEFIQKSGDKICDLLETGSVCLYLISEKMKNILEENKLTGWKTYSIKLLKKNGEILSNYYGFSVIGRCGPINWSKCTIVEKKLVPDGPLCKLYKGLYLDLDTWDKSDFFIPENSLRIIVCKKVLDILKAKKITNVQLDNLGEEEILIHLIKK